MIVKFYKTTLPHYIEMRLFICYNLPKQRNCIVKIYEKIAGMNRMMKVGGTELLIILIVCLFAIGPERLPKVARMMGRSLAAFKKSMNEATSELREVSEEFKDVTDEIANAQKDMKKAIQTAGDEIEKAEKDQTADKKMERASEEKPDQQHKSNTDAQQDAASE